MTTSFWHIDAVGGRPPQQEARSGAELRRWFAAASAAVERRQASAPRWVRAAPIWRAGWTDAPAGVPLPFCLRSMIEPTFLRPPKRASRRREAGPTAGLGVTRSCSAGRFWEWRWHNSGAAASRERDCLHPPPRKRGRDSPPFVKLVYAAGDNCFVARSGSKTVWLSSMAQATARRRSATERSARP